MFAAPGQLPVRLSDLPVGRGRPGDADWGRVMPLWRVEQFGGRRVERGCVVEADTEQEAIAEAGKLFRINPSLWFKLSARRIETKPGNKPGSDDGSHP
jgi:hypothetical protein